MHLGFLFDFIYPYCMCLFMSTILISVLAVKLSPGLCRSVNLTVKRMCLCCTPWRRKIGLHQRAFILFSSTSKTSPYNVTPAGRQSPGKSVTGKKTQHKPLDLGLLCCPRFIQGRRLVSNTDCVILSDPENAQRCGVCYEERRVWQVAYSSVLTFSLNICLKS